MTAGTWNDERMLQQLDGQSLGKVLNMETHNVANKISLQFFNK